MFVQECAAAASLSELAVLRIMDMCQLLDQHLAS